MNTKKRKLTTFACATLLATCIIGCDKEKNTSSEKSSSVKIEELLPDVATTRKENLPCSYITISFNDGEYGVLDSQNGRIRGCDGNTGIIIEKNDDCGIPLTPKSDLKKILVGVDNYIKESYEVSEYKILEFSQYFYGSLECQYVRFALMDDHETHSLVVKTDINAKDSNPVIVQCIGSCGSYDCDTSFDIFCGEVRCNCSECAMKIKVLD